MSYQAHRAATAGEQIRLYLLLAAVLVGLGLLLWRLSRRRAGFAQLGLLVAVLGFGTLPALPFLLEPLPFRALIWVYYLLSQLGVFLMWIVGEAELREVRPGSIDHWDRVRHRRPIQATGEKVLLGFAAGCVLGAFRTAAGALAEAFGGGDYTNVLAILPDYWTLTSPWNQGLALAAMTVLFVGCGGRLGGRPGAIVGAALSTAAWSLVIWTTPLGWSVGLGLVAALAASALAWHHGLLTLTVPAESLHRTVGAELAWEMNPADVVGGDFLDVVEDGDGRLWIAVADAAGHGISCSVLTAFTKAAVVEHAVAGASAAEAMAGIRGLFGRLRIQRTLVTLLLAVYDPRRAPRRGRTARLRRRRPRRGLLRRCGRGGLAVRRGLWLRALAGASAGPPRGRREERPLGAPRRRRRPPRRGERRRRRHCRRRASAGVALS